MPGVTELATKIIGANVRLYVPNEWDFAIQPCTSDFGVDYVGSRSTLRFW